MDDTVGVMDVRSPMLELVIELPTDTTDALERVSNEWPDILGTLYEIVRFLNPTTVARMFTVIGIPMLTVKLEADGLAPVGSVTDWTADTKLIQIEEFVELVV